MKSGVPRLLATVLALPLAAQAYNTGDLDPSFGTGGKLTMSIGSDAVANALVLQPDGKLVAGGYTQSGVTPSEFALVRYDINGSPDASFQGGSPPYPQPGLVTTAIGSGGAVANALVLQPDGKLVAAGGYSEVCLARYNADGSLDTSFGVGGKVTTTIGGSAIANALVLQPDGKLVVAGSAYIGSTRFALARYNADGSLDTGFGTSGKVTTAFGTVDDRANALVRQPDGKLVVAGYTNKGTTNQRNYDFALARYNADGSLDTGFGLGGKVTTAVGTGNDAANALVLQPDGKLAAGGYAWNGTTSTFGLARYNADGSLDTSFGVGGTVMAYYFGAGANALVLQPDGKLVAAGGHLAFDFVRYNPDGSPERTWVTIFRNPSGTALDASASALVLQPDGKLVTAGSTYDGSSDAFALARYFNNACGDGIVQTSEQCDAEAANGTTASCCTGSCQFVVAGTPCDGGVCGGLGTCGPPTTTTTSTAATTTIQPPTTSSTSTTSTTTTIQPPTTTTSSTSTTTISTTTTTTSTSTTTTHPPGSSTSTTLTMSSTTTTTTVPCPEAGFEGVRCVLEVAIDPLVCTGEIIPKSIRRRIGRALKLINRGAVASSAMRAEKLARKTATTLSQAMPRVATAVTKGKLSTACGDTLVGIFTDAEQRAEALSAAP